MQTSRTRDRDYLRAALVGACALLAALAVLIFKQAGDVRSLNARLSAVYQKAFYETCELMEGMSTNLRKLLVTGSAQQEQMLLSEIARQAQGAQDDLSQLPLGEEAVSATIKFVNQAGDFATSLAGKLAGGAAISDADYENISTLSESAGQLSARLGQLLSRYESGEDIFAGDRGETGQESLYPLTDPAVSYPALLYDGPFSDAAGQTEYRALAGLPDVDAAGAERALRAFLGAGAVTELRLEGESSIPVDCYEFSVTANGYSMSAGVTKAGAQVLYMLPNEDVTEAVLSDAEGVEAARAFLAARGYGEMHESYFSRYDGILTVNFAAVQDDVVLYPDLVKVQVSLRDGAVIGLEAGGYLRNHVEREFTLPALSEEEALARLGGRLTAEEARLCVIPENANEYLCYEIDAYDESGEYLIYIDAQTGAEREILEVISEENGTLVM